MGRIAFALIPQNSSQGVRQQRSNIRVEQAAGEIANAWGNGRRLTEGLSGSLGGVTGLAPFGQSFVVGSLLAWIVCDLSLSVALQLRRDGKAIQAFRAEPRLNRAAAQRRFDDADRHADPGLQIAGKKVCHGGKISHGFRSGRLPFALGVGLGGGGTLVVRGKVANQRIVRSRFFLLPVQGLDNRKKHVRLAGLSQTSPTRTLGTMIWFLPVTTRSCGFALAASGAEDTIHLPVASGSALLLWPLN